MKITLNESQQDFGIQIVTDYAKKHNIDYQTAIGILEDALGFKSAWDWVNLGIFLCNERTVT